MKLSTFAIVIISIAATVVSLLAFMEAPAGAYSVVTAGMFAVSWGIFCHIIGCIANDAAEEEYTAEYKLDNDYSDEALDALVAAQLSSYAAEASLQDLDIRLANLGESADKLLAEVAEMRGNVMTIVASDDTWVLTPPCGGQSRFMSEPAMAFKSVPATDADHEGKVLFNIATSPENAFRNHTLANDLGARLLVALRGDVYVSFTLASTEVTPPTEPTTPAPAVAPMSFVKMRELGVKHLGLINTRASNGRKFFTWGTSTLPNIVFQLVGTDDGMEIHFSDVTIKEEWIKAGENKDLPLPLTGTRTPAQILGIFKHMLEVLERLGLKDVSTVCRCKKRRRIYLLAAKRLGVNAHEEGERIFFS